MVVVQLSEGDHTIRWTMDGYDQLEARIKVSPAGTLSCLSVSRLSNGVWIDVFCNQGTTPGISISGSSVTGRLIQSPGQGYTPTPTPAPSPGAVCDWIIQKGGVSDLSIPELLELVDAYLGMRDIGFVPANQEIMGCVDYYMGFMQSGNSKTGCAY